MITVRMLVDKEQERLSEASPTVDVGNELII